MITQAEQEYLEKIPKSQLVNNFPYDPRIEVIAKTLKEQIQQIVPSLQVLFIGSSALKVSGQNDIDLYILCNSSQFSDYYPLLCSLLGKEASQSEESICWTIEGKEFPIEVYLTDPDTPSMKRQLAVHTLLSKDPFLLKQYVQLKEQAATLGYYEYQRCKYEFYNTILT